MYSLTLYDTLTWRSPLKIQFQFGRVMFALAGRRLTGNVRQK
jgi:hypothetical protein